MTRMENSARRRLNCIYRHISVPQDKPNNVLYQALLSNGQLKNLEIEAVIIGGMVLDIHATPSLPPNPRTTTPGKVNYVLGGVARNVAECMSKFGTKPFMISVLGSDIAGILKQQHIKTAVVINVFDVNGEVAAGVASVEAIENFLTSEWIHRFKHEISSARILMVDANLNLPALEASCQIAAASKIPVWFEPVSVTKSTRIVPIAKYVSFASPNEAELIAMANALSGGGDTFSFTPKDSWPIESLFRALKPAICALLKNGVQVVIVTVGPDGVFVCSKRDDSHNGLHKAMAAQNQIPDSASTKTSSRLFAVHFPALPASVVRLTGAGDCLVGGTLSSLRDGLDVMRSVAVGIAAAKAAVEAETNVPRCFDVAAIADDARLVYSGRKVVCNESMF